MQVATNQTKTKQNKRKSLNFKLVSSILTSNSYGIWVMF